VAEVIVPFMVGFYILMVFWVLYVHFDRIDDAFALIFNEAFNPKAVEGGLIGAMLQGFQRAVFSNEAGLVRGIAHAPAKVNTQLDRGLVSLYEAICRYCGLVLHTYKRGLWIIYRVVYPWGELLLIRMRAIANSAGACDYICWIWFCCELVSKYLRFCNLSICIFNMISWSYYGERAWVYLFGVKSSIIF